ncbi:hypothetical protein MBLNU457_5867t1 [Dothideomycetes sp. NU457]
MADQKMQLADWLDDLCVRFIINLPSEELEDIPRICFQIEEAQWFYEDFIRPIDPTLPSLNLKDFSMRILQHCPLTSQFSNELHQAAYQEFLGYKTRVPVRGAIILNQEMDKVLLVKGWKKGASWSFPRGKINKDEDDLVCAIREVDEETGYDIAKAGLAKDPESIKSIEVTMREQHMKLFVIRGVPEDTEFAPKTRKEISKIQWYKFSDLPTFKKNKQAAQGAAYGQQAYGQEGGSAKFYMVAPFLGPLKKWINQQRRLEAQYVSDAHEEPIQEQSQPPTQSSSEVDPAVELRRLLNVGSRPISHAPTPEQHQAGKLLAMLRGQPAMSLQLPQQQPSVIPHTPLEQITAFPQEPPRSPHYNHARESPEVRRQPPPQFPYASPQRQHDQGLQRGPDPSGHQIAVNGHGLNAMHASQSLQAAAYPMTGTVPQHMQHSVNQRPQLPPQMFAPQGPNGPLAQAPAPPQASQLPPPPQLSTHAVNLLNAFKSPNQTQQAGPTHVQPLASPLDFPQQSRSQHQNSLLEMFKKPSALSQTQQALPIPQQQSPLQQPGVASGQDSPAQTITQPPMPPPTRRKSSALNMITRTLPKVKLEDRAPPMPQLDDANFPTLGGLAAKTASAMRKTEEQQASIEAPSNPPLAQIKILQRPASSQASKPLEQTAAPPVSSPSRPVSRGKPEPSGPQVPIRILQRPGSRPTESPIDKESRESMVPNTALSRLPSGQYQPQLLKRPDAVENQAPVQKPVSAPDTSMQEQQKNNLLALFSKSTAPSPAISQPGSLPASSPTNLDNTAMRSYSNGVKAPTPHQAREAIASPPPSLQSWNHPNVQVHRPPPSAIGTPSAETMKSRQFSTTSFASGVGSDGMRSPGTPVEAKGFLLDYLNGLAKTAK